MKGSSNVIATTLSIVALLLLIGFAPEKVLAQTDLYQCTFASNVPLAQTVEFNGHRYCISSEDALNWDQARAQAARKTVRLTNGTILKGHLLTITSQAELNFIVTNFMNPHPWIYRQLWLGAYQFSSDVEPTGNWAWITGEEVGDIVSQWAYNFVFPGEPGDNPGNPLLLVDPNLYNVEDALRMLKFNGNFWQDFSRGNAEEPGVLWYVAEFDSIGDNFFDFRAQPAITSGSLWRSLGFDSGTPPAGWETLDFDDSAWPPARAPYPNPGQPPNVRIPGSNAEFMWYDPLGTSDGGTGTIQGLFRYTFYENLPPHSRPLVGLADIQVDDDYDLFVNGKLAFQNHDGGFADVVDRVNFSPFLQNGENVIAIHAVDGGWSNPFNRGFEDVLFDATVQPQADLLLLLPAFLSTHSEIRRYDGKAGAFLGQFGTGCNPLDIVFGPDQNLYIAESIQQGTLFCEPSFGIMRFNGKTGTLDPNDPHANFSAVGFLGGIAFGPDDNLYVSDPANDNVARYQGPFGANPGEFIDIFASPIADPHSGGHLAANLLFGPDNNLYVSTIDTVKRYQGPFSASPGAFMDTFIAAGSGGLDQIGDMVFGRDKRLYVSSSSNAVLRFEGPSSSRPGAFLDQFIAVAFPHALAFGPDGDLYVSNPTGIARYDGRTGVSKGLFATAPRGGIRILFSAVPNFVWNLGDFNNDGCIDRTDLNMVLACVQHTGPCNPAFDLNGDGKIDISDSRKLVLLFTNPGGAACTSGH